MHRLIRILYFIIFPVITLVGCDNNPPEEVVLPKIAVGDVTKLEGDEDNVFEFRVLLAGENTQGVSFNYQTVAGSATEGEDYEKASGSITIDAGTGQAVIPVTVKGDTENEGEEEFTVSISGVQGAIITTAEGTGTIRNDDEGKLSIPTTGYTTPETYSGMTLVWQDEFEGTQINPQNWTFEIGNGCPNLCGWGNNELQYYREENASLVDGNLVITAKKEAFGGQDYTSTRMITKGKQEFKYGRIDIRAVLPEGQGMWPALWMLGANIDSVAWPASGEIDIMELVGHIPNQVHGTVHYGNDPSTRQFTGGSKTISGGAKFSDEFHVFSLEWEENVIKWYMDDQLFYQVSSSNVNPYPFNQDFFFIFNIAVGGDWPGNPDNSTSFPQYMMVDYIRVFQKN